MEIKRVPHKYEKSKVPFSIMPITKINPILMDPPEQDRINSTCCKIFIQLFKLGYFLCIVPFSFKFDNGNYVITRNKIQMTACALISGSTLILITLAASYKGLDQIKNLHKDPTGVFRSLELATYIILLWIIYRIFWTKEKLVLKCLNDLEIGLGSDDNDLRSFKLESAPSHCSKRPNLRGIDVKNILRIILGLLYFVFRLVEVIHKMTKLANPEVKSVVVSQEYFFQGMFFYIPKPALQDLHSLFCLQLLYFFVTLSVKLATNYSALLVFGMIWCYSLICKKFCEDLKAIRNNGGFRQKFTEFKRSVKNLNKVFGTLVLGVTCNFLPRYMIWSIEIFFMQIRIVSFREKLSFSTDSVYFVFFYVVAARMYHKVQSTLGRTILKKQAQLKMEEKEFVGYLYQIQTAPLGVSGNGIFTISYQSIASIVSLLFTYTIVVVQFTSNSNKNA